MELKDESMAISTHLLFNTINHEHLDTMVYWATGDFPDSGLMLVECGNGKWFVEIDFGHRYDHVDGISKPSVLPYVNPTFFDIENSAREFAIDIIKINHPELSSRDFTVYFKD